MTHATARRYFGWDGYEDFAQAWSEYDYQTKSYPAVDGMATDDEVLFASYGKGEYEGDAFVIFRRDGKLYEVHGSHCSCYELEGQWEPEETSLEALYMRPWWSTEDGRSIPFENHDPDARAALRELFITLAQQSE